MIFSEGRAEFRRTDNQIDTHTEIVVSPEDDIELRRCRLTNRGRERRTLTFLGVVVLVDQLGDLRPDFIRIHALSLQSVLLAVDGAHPVHRGP